jgi:hypothetical protein
MTVERAFRLVRAEGVGFEPTRSARPQTVFKTVDTPERRSPETCRNTPNRPPDLQKQSRVGVPR